MTVKRKRRGRQRRKESAACVASPDASNSHPFAVSPFPSSQTSNLLTTFACNHPLTRARVKKTSVACEILVLKGPVKEVGDGALPAMRMLRETNRNRSQHQKIMLHRYDVSHRGLGREQVKGGERRGGTIGRRAQRHSSRLPPA